MSPERSLCIEATAGSGKTTLMVERLRYLLEDQQVPPDQCLAITFTDKAAKEMMDRLMHVLQETKKITQPLACVSRMNIGTIHSICQIMLKKHALLIHQSPNYRVWEGVELTKRLHDTLQKLCIDHRLHPPPWLTKCLSIWSMDQLRQLCLKAYANRGTIGHWLDNGFYDIDPAPLEKAPVFQSIYDASCFAFKELIQAFLQKVDDDKAQDDWLDHDDMLFKTYQLLAHVDWLRQQYQDQYQFIFVDEFQDTSPIQWQIVTLLCGEKDPFEQKKLWVVGDRFQAIYGFRGADDALMQMVIDTQHPQLEHKKNTVNYRSHPAIIHFINALFERLFKDQGHSFLSMDPKKETQQSASIRCYLHDDVCDELCCIGQYIRSQHAQGIRYQDMAILVRKNMDVQRLKSYLTSIQVPCQVSKGAGLCELDAVQIVICFLLGLLNADDDIAWMSIAHDILNQDIGKVSENQRVKDQVANHPLVLGWDKAMNRGHMIEELTQLVWGLPLQLSTSDETAIQTLLSKFKHQTSDRLSMLEWLSDCIENPKRMGTENKAAFDAVHVMTLHAAKGLEFDVVVVPFIDAQFNFSSTDPMILSREYGMGLSITGYTKENAIRTTILNHEKERSTLEEIRLFYVTLTRAKCHILITGKRLKRKNASRLSLCLPYLDDRGSECVFTFDYEKQSPGTTKSSPTCPEETGHASMVTYSTHAVNQPRTWSISNILDASVCQKQMILKKLRAIDLIETDAQKEGLRMHDQLAQALVQKRSSPLPSDPKWMAILIQGDWYQRMVSSGRLSVEAPFEFHHEGGVVRGRFDAVWFCDTSMTFQVFEFKRSIGNQVKRYQQQVNFYANVIEDLYPTYRFDRVGSAIVNMTTGDFIQVEPNKGHLRDAFMALRNHVFLTNPSACDACDFHPYVPDCSQTPFILDGE
jgi:DNA helicase-2/ATP-dependent DNA helicase PcrA